MEIAQMIEVFGNVDPAALSWQAVEQACVWLAENDKQGFVYGVFNEEYQRRANFETNTRSEIVSPLFAQPLELKPSIEELKRQRDTMMAAIEMVLEEVAGDAKPYSADSYLPARMVDTLAKLRADIKASR